MCFQQDRKLVCITLTTFLDSKVTNMLSAMFANMFITYSGMFGYLFRAVFWAHCGRGLSQRMDQGVLRWFGHAERMGNERVG